MNEDSMRETNINHINKNIGTQMSNDAPNVNNDRMIAKKWPMKANITRGRAIANKAISMDNAWMRQKLRALSFLSLDAR